MEKIKLVVKLAIFIFFAFLNLIAIGQKNSDYLQYHTKLLKIEEYNSRGSFDSSIINYNDLFNLYEFVFAKDTYNACQIAALQNHNVFEHFFYLCAKSGIKKYKLLNNKLIKSKFDADTATLNALFNKGRDEYFKRIDIKLREEMIQRYNKEQKYKGSEKYYEICNENFNRILELSKQGNFPGENIIGIDDDIENIIIPTLCHYPYSYRILEPFLKEAVNNGKITPLSLMYVFGFNQTRKSILYTNEIPVDTINFNIAYNIPFGKQSTDFVEVNKQRALKKIFSLSIQNSLRSLNSKYGIDYLLGY